jgi:PPOX class probable F420-dependent enzyme
MQLSDQVRAFLMERRFCVLATIGESGMPQQTVMWYDLDGDEVLMNTARGRFKDRHLQRDPRASICIEDDYRYVTLAGSVTFDEDPDRSQADIARLTRRYEPEEVVEGMIANFQRQQRVTLRLHVERVVTNGFEQ